MDYIFFNQGEPGIKCFLIFFESLIKRKKPN